jgi:hypothetical protein
MKLSVVRAGGVSGIVSRTEVASGALKPEDAEALQNKVRESGILDMSAEPSQQRPVPDEFQYELTVEDGDRTHTVRAPEGELPQNVRSLITWADSVPGGERKLGPPGRG